MPGTRNAKLMLWVLFGATLGFSGTTPAQEPPLLVATTPPRPPEEQQKMFHLPPGFEIQLVAAEPDIRKPINIAFDDQGRLWATQSVEYPFPAASDAVARDCVKVLEDRDGDGRAEHSSTFVDGLNIPIGVMPIAHGCIVYSIPNIYRCLDRDGDGRADTRDLLYGNFGYADTHGMASSFTWGLDGWLYACHGFANNSEVKGADGNAIKMNSGNTFRMRPDGSHVEQFTWGQVNPFGLTFDPLGNLYSADCHSRPVYMLLRGGYYPSFGKPHDGLGFAPEMCRHEHGSTGIAGIVYYAADQFPVEYRETVFIGNPVSGRINHDRLESRGSTLLAVEQPDFVRCDDPWFRPVDLKLGPDGALYVADFYNKIIGHYEVPLTHPGRDRERGRIWRIVYRGPDGTGQAASPRADWDKASVAELIDDLGHANIVVRTKAGNQLVDRIGTEAVGALRAAAASSTRPVQRLQALWALERLGALELAMVQALAADSDPAVRTHTMRMLGERRELRPAERAMLVARLADANAFVQRASADALGRHPAPANIQPLLELRDQVPSEDTHLLHVVRMALREQVRSDESIAGLAWSRQPAKARHYLADVLPGVPSPSAAAALLAHLEQEPQDRSDIARYVKHVARYASEDRLGGLYTFAERSRGGDLQDQFIRVRAIQEGIQERGGKFDPELRDWAAELARSLIDTQQVRELGNAVELIRAMKLEALEPSLIEIAGSQGAFPAQRPAAITALAALHPRRHVALFGRILGDSTEPLQLRQHVAAVLGSLNQPEAQELLLEGLRSAPEQLGVYIASALAASRRGADRLLLEMEQGKASSRLLQHPFVFGRLEATRLDGVKDRVAKLTEGLPPADARLQELINARRAGFAAVEPDQTQGAALFEKHCSNCHSLGGRGSKVGPQLDGIALRGLDRLLEDVLDPNRNVDQAFRSSMLELENGQLLTGLVTSDEGDSLVLVDAMGKEQRIAKKDVTQRAVSKLSPMPANVPELMSEAEFYHLLAHLLAQQKPAEPGALK